MKRLILLGFMVATFTAGASWDDLNVCDDAGGNCRIIQSCEGCRDLPSYTVIPLDSEPRMESRGFGDRDATPAPNCIMQWVNGLWVNVC
jgi:hypothetical protein